VIAFTCPQCKSRLSVKDEFAGRSSECPTCRQPVQVPATETATLPPATQSSELPALTRPPVETATLPPPAGTHSSERSSLQPPVVEAATLPPPIDTDPFRTLAGETVGPAPSAATQVPGYEVLGELGRGGMGVVYKARQINLKRIVALKMILGGSHAGAAALERFKTEAEAVARIQHPGIVAVYEIGEHDGLPFFSLEFCPGGSLASQLDGTPLPPMKAAALVEKLARAVEAAHEVGVVHRDLKPANVLLAGDGTPKVTDFGLAKKLDDEQGMTASGAVMGTPSYMAPEQATGKAKLVGQASDVYSLGAILYELLSGRAPFKGATAMDTMMQVATDEPVPPSRLQRRTPIDIETICLKCLEKNPKRRYASAIELADELHRYQAGEPIRARPISTWRRGLKWARRRPTMAALLAVSVAATLSIVIGGASFTIKLRAERDNVQKQLDVARRTLYASQLMRVGSVYQQDPEQGLALLQDTYICPVPWRDASWGLYYHLCCGDGARTFMLKGEFVLSVAFSPDGKTLALGSGNFDKPVPRDVKLWDVATGQERAAYTGHTASISSVAFSPDSKTLASGSADKTVRLWDVTTGRQRAVLNGHTHLVNSVAFSPDGMTLASGSSDEMVRLWDVATGQERAVLNAYYSVHAVTFSPDGKSLAAGTGATVMLWDVGTSQQRAMLVGQTDVVYSFQSVAFSPDGKTLASGSADKTVRLWDVATGQERAVLKGHSATVNSVAFSHDGKTIASGCAARLVQVGEVKLWDVGTGQERASLREPWVHSVAFSPDGKTLASGSGNPNEAVRGKSAPDGQLTLWAVDTGRERAALKHTDVVYSVAFSPDGKTLVSGSADKTVRLWDVGTAQARAVLKGHTSGVLSVAFSPDGKTVASGSRDTTVKLWDVATGRNLADLTVVRKHMSGVTSLAFSPDGKTLASGGADKTVILWIVGTGQARADLKGHKDAVMSVAFSPDGTVLASGSQIEGGAELKLWDVKTGQARADLKGQARGCRLAFSPDGKIIASGSGADKVQMWDVGTGQELASHDLSVSSLAFSPDGRSLAFGNIDFAVKLWDMGTGKDRTGLKGHTSVVSSVAFSPDGKTLASGSYDNTVKLWDISPFATDNNASPNK
jgi:WD40 repeat protein/serine/threonine protein kinase